MNAGRFRTASNLPSKENRFERPAKRTGLTQEKFAARLGVTFPTINRWENGRARPSPLALQKIEELLREMGAGGSDLLRRIVEK